LNKIAIKTITYLIFLLLIFSSYTLSARNNFIDKNENTSSNLSVYEYYTYQEMTDLFQLLGENHSDILSYTSLGITYEGRNIWMVKLSDNVDTNEDEPGVLLMGAHHGNEKPSYESLIFFIEYIVENFNKKNTDNDNDGFLNEDIIDGIDNDDDGLIDEDPSEERVREIVNNTEIFVIPMVNPDGVEYKTSHDDGWRKNRAPKEGQTINIGVDLNRNYAYKWELYKIFPIAYHDAYMSNPESFNYRGEAPFSEKETTAIKKFVESEDIKISISYHSYGEFITYPWTHTSQRTPNEKQFVSIGRGFSSINKYYLYQGRGTILPWPGGTIGTSENWLYAKNNILSFVIELCKTRAPKDPNVVYDYCIKHVGVNLYACEQAPSVYLYKNLIDIPFPFLKILSFLKTT